MYHTKKNLKTRENDHKNIKFMSLNFHSIKKNVKKNNNQYVMWVVYARKNTKL